jgi:hypothetical protein
MQRIDQSEYIEFSEMASKLGISRQSAKRKFINFPGVINAGSGKRGRWKMLKATWEAWRADQEGETERQK